MAKERMRSVDATVKKEMANIFTKLIFPLFDNCLITITDVRTSPDLRYCQIFVSVMGDKKSKKDVFASLEQHKQECFKLFNKRLRMKLTPMITWRDDDTPEKADQMSQLLDNLEIPEYDDEEGENA